MKNFTIALLLCLATSVAFAKDKQPSAVPAGSALCIDVDGSLNTFIAAELMRQHLPYTVQIAAGDPPTCSGITQFTLKGSAEVSGTKAKVGASGIPYTSKATRHDEYAGAVTIVSNATNTLVWGYTVDNGKLQQAAERIVKQMKKDLR